MYEIGHRTFMMWEVNWRFLKKPNYYEAETILPVMDKRKKKRGGRTEWRCDD